jgi:hypothetical protein
MPAPWPRAGTGSRVGVTTSDEAAEAYDKMLSAGARFRMVLTTG